MKIRNNSSRARLGTAIAALAIGLSAVASPTAAQAQPRAYASGTYRPSAQVALSVGEGQMINLPRSVASVWTSNPKVADVYVNSPRQINLFGKDNGEATVIATAADGSVVYGAQVRVSQNLPSINEVLKAAMPEADVRVINIGQTAILTGTVASPEDAAFAAQVASSELNPGVDMSKDGSLCKICVINRLKVATPLQVNLKVKIAEVSRDLLKQVGVNLFSSDATGGFKFGIGQGFRTWPVARPFEDFERDRWRDDARRRGQAARPRPLGTLDLAQTDGLATILAEPNLTALVGRNRELPGRRRIPDPGLAVARRGDDRI